MKSLVRVLSLSVLAVCPITATLAQTTPAAAPGDLKLHADLLSDTNGADLAPYMRTLLAEIKARWTPLVAAAGDRTGREQETDIRFTLAPDGTLLAMRLENSTHNDPLNKAAWAATKDAAYGPLPSQMKDAKLELRIHFFVN